MLTIMHGDLLDTDCKIIAHQVACTGYSMEYGLAAQIKAKYPGTASIYSSICTAAKEIGNEKNLLGLNIGCVTSASKIIVHMFSSLETSTDYDALANCLLDLLHIAEKHHVYEVALPYGIGCGLAGGNWNLVFRLIEQVFGESLVNCKLYKLADED